MEEFDGIIKPHEHIWTKKDSREDAILRRGCIALTGLRNYCLDSELGSPTPFAGETLAAIYRAFGERRTVEDLALAREFVVELKKRNPRRGPGKYDNDYKLAKDIAKNHRPVNDDWEPILDALADTLDKLTVHKEILNQSGELDGRRMPKSPPGSLAR